MKCVKRYADVEQFNGREAKTATLYGLLACVFLLCPRHLNR